MSDYIKRIRTTTGDKQIDYTALANLPTLVTVDNTLTENGKAADAKIVGDKLSTLTQRSDANTIKGHAEGEVVRVDDVSPIGHVVSVNVCGKNIIPYPYKTSSVNKNGGSFTVQEDGGILASGTPTDYISIPIYNNIPLVKHGIITLSITGTAKNVSCDLLLRDADSNVIAAVYTAIEGNPIETINLDDYPMVANWTISIKRTAADKEMSGVVYPQIEFGNTATEHTPYVDPSTATLTYGGETYTPNSNGSVEGLTSTYPSMEMSVPDGFNVFLEYNQDTNAVIKKLTDAIVALGGTV